MSLSHICTAVLFSVHCKLIYNLYSPIILQSLSYTALSTVGSLQFLTL